jgi:hypothetical protein
VGGGFKIYGKIEIGALYWIERGSISQNFFCRLLTAFGKKIAIQFHQKLKLQISSQTWCNFCQICSQL